MVRPDLVGRHLDLEVEYGRRQIEFLAAHGFRYFWGGGDFASNEGPMYSPRHFRQFLRPRLARLTEIAHRCGGLYLFSSDGNLWPVADALFGASGVDGYYEVDRRAGMDLRRLHDAFPHLTTIGNISSHTLHVGAVEEVVREAEDALAEGKRFSKTVVGVSNAFVPGTPMKNIEALLQTLREHR